MRINAALAKDFDEPFLAVEAEHYLGRDALDAFTAALRDYVVRVMAAVEPGDRKSQALADLLLAPLAAWTPSPARPAKPVGRPEAPGPEIAGPIPEAPTSAPA